MKTIVNTIVHADRESAELANTQSLDLTGIRLIEISYLSEDVTLHRHDENRITVKEYMNKQGEEFHADILVEKDRISISHGRRKNLKDYRGYTEIFLPQSYRENLDIFTVSGNIGASASYRFKTFRAESTSGKISLSGITAGQMHIGTISGDVTLNELDSRPETTRFSVKSSSGDIRVQNAAGCGNFESTSGDMKIDFTEIIHNIISSSISGKISLKIPEAAGFSLRADTIIGKISAFRSDAIAVDGKKASGDRKGTFSPSIDLSTISGDITLETH